MKKILLSILFGWLQDVYTPFTHFVRYKMIVLITQKLFLNISLLKFYNLLFANNFLTGWILLHWFFKQFKANEQQRLWLFEWQAPKYLRVYSRKEYTKVSCHWYFLTFYNIYKLNKSSHSLLSYVSIFLCRFLCQFA